jgi:prepilin-type N-terminal cleavage/methylation domain-containing protein
MKKFAKNARAVANSGFSLVELMVVVAIIGILSGVAFPKYQAFKARAKQTEAKAGLNGVYLAVNSYNSNYGDYPDSGDSKRAAGAAGGIGFELPPKTMYQYTFQSRSNVSVVNDGGFAALAMFKGAAGILSGRGDIHRINTNRWSCTPFDGVGNVGPTGTQQITTGKSSTVVGACPQWFTLTEANATKSNAASTDAVSSFVAATDGER